jgi:hypothetical protein
MLEVARENCKRLGANSVSLLHANDLDSLAPASVDLIHSYIVFQQSLSLVENSSCES